VKKLLVLLIMLLAFPGHVSAQENPLQISPVRSNYIAQPGSTIRVAMTIKNPSNKIVSVTVIPKDFEASPNLTGEPQIIEGSSLYGISNWLTDVNTDKKLNILGGQSIAYEAVFRVPNFATSRTYFGLVTFRVDNSAAVSTSLGSIVFITVGNPVTSHEITDLKYGDSDDATKPHGIFTATLKNNSDGLVTPKLTLKITNKSGRKIAELKEDKEGSVLPNSSRNYTFSPASELPNEQLTATVSAVDQNGVSSDKNIQVNLAPVQDPSEQKEAKPPKTSLTIPLLLAGLIVAGTGTIIFLNRRKTAQNKQPAEDTGENEKYTNKR